jgi:ankyrin repeat protein
MWACLRGESDLVLEFLQHGRANVHAKNKVGSTALDVAHGLEIIDIAISLAEHATKKCCERERNTE